MTTAEVPIEIVDRLTRSACRIHIPYETLWRALRADTKPSGQAADHVADARHSICERAKQAMIDKGRTSHLWLNWSDIAESIQDSAGLKPTAPMIYHSPGQLMLFAS